MTNTNRTGGGPLQGVKVLDLTEHMAGPFCTMILADMGAEVVKLERPGKGDSSRAMGDGSERNPYFRYINRNKKGVTLDYKQPEGRAIFLKLVEGVDVLVENYRPTVMPRAGLGWEDLRKVNPRLIYAQLSGLGYDGPFAARGGFDLIAQGMGGIMHVTGEPDGPPTSVGLPICVLGTGMWGVQGILAALYERAQTGRGRLVECSLLETAMGWMSGHWAAYAESGKHPQRDRSGNPRVVVFQAVPTADVVVTNPTHFAIALKYDPDTMEAPKCVAKGQDFVALRIREVAFNRQSIDDVRHCWLKRQIAARFN
jgi:crotonobetainyl-CoA:carnitine CoA-transferase CaiB-like acyl-CoA transferase